MVYGNGYWFMVSIAFAMRSHCVRTPDEQNALQNVLTDFFELTENGYVHKRCEKTVAEYHGKSDKARQSANARWHKENNVLQSQESDNHANALQSDSEGNANHKPLTINQEPIKNIRAPRFNAHAHLLSLGVDESVAQDFIALRKQKRATVTLTALNGIEREAAKANLSLNAALEIVCARGWQSFKADWVRPEMLKHGDSKPDWAVEKENRMRAFAGDSAAKPQIQSTGNIIDITPQTKLIGG